jgi:hypothetical protein
MRTLKEIGRILLPHDPDHDGMWWVGTVVSILVCLLMAATIIIQATR